MELTPDQAKAFVQQRLDCDTNLKFLIKMKDELATQSAEQLALWKQNVGLDKKSNEKEDKEYRVIAMAAERKRQVLDGLINAISASEHKLIGIIVKSLHPVPVRARKHKDLDD